MKVYLKAAIYLLVLTGTLILSVGYAHALVDATEPREILNIAKGYGSATLTTDSQGDPKIKGRIDGTQYGIYFYGCNDDNEDCDDIQFSTAWAGIPVSLTQINAWNAKKRFGKGYLDSDGDPAIQMTVNIDYGVSTRNLEDSFNWWTKVLAGFKEEVLGK